MFRKILVLILLLAVAGGIAFALYYFFFRVPPTGVNAPTGNENVNGGGLTPSINGETTPGVNAPTGIPGVTVPTPIAQGGLTVVTPLSTTAATSPSLTTSGALNYYSRADGKFYRVNPDGTTTSLSNKAFYNVDTAKFDPSGNKAILEYPDGSNIFYDFTTNRQVTLPQHWEAFDFSPQGDQIVAKSMGVDPAARFLIVANPDGSAAQAVQELGDNGDKVQVAWSPNNQIIGTATTGQSYGLDRQEVYFIGKNQENFKSMIVEGLGTTFEPHWAPSGNQLLYSVAGSISDWKPELWVVDAVGDDIGKNRHSLHINTWADKCAFSGDQTLYCAVPNDMPRGAGLQPSVEDTTPDTIYKINLSTGLQTKVADPEGGHTVGTMMVAPDGSKLYFTDKAGSILNQIQLKP